MLLEAQLKVEMAWAAARNKPSEQPHMGALAAVVAETTATIDQKYSDPEKLRTNRVFWINGICASADIDGNPGCTMDASELTTGSKTYTLTRNKHRKFAVPYRDFETSVFERIEPMVKGLRLDEKGLLEGLNTRVQSFINDPANLTNYAIGNYVVDPSDNTVVIAPELWTPRVLGIATRYAKQIGMLDPFIISGAALYDMLYDAKKDEGMETNIGSAARIRDHRIYVDFTMDSTLETEKFFLIERGALAILNRPVWKNNTPISLDDVNNNSGRLAWNMTGSAMNTPIGVGLDGKPVTMKFDRHVQRICTDGTDFKDVHATGLRADIVRRPDDDCSDDATLNGGTFTDKYTGIVAFKCGNPASIGSGSGS